MNKIKIDFEMSHGSYLYDINTASYFLDLQGMYSTLPLGYNHCVFDDDFEYEIRSLSRIKATHPLLDSQQYQDFIKAFQPYLFSEHVYFAQSGSLAVEQALKCVLAQKRPYSSFIYALNDGFHGRGAWGIATDSKTYFQDIPILVHTPVVHRTLDEIILDLEDEINSFLIKGVFVELIQCTAGDIYPTWDKLKKLNQLCTKRGVAFIIDEVQTGFVVTGSMWHYEQIGLNPDLLIFGKKAQVSGICVKEPYHQAIDERILGTTWNGDLIDFVRSKYILKAYKKYALLERVKYISKNFLNFLYSI